MAVQRLIRVIGGPMQPDFMPDNGRASHTRLDELRRREQALKVVIAAELERESKRKARQRDRLVSILGSAVIEEANRSPNFKVMLKQTLNTAVVDEKSRRLLSAMEWL